MISAKEFRQLNLEEQLEKTKIDYSNMHIWQDEYLRVKNEDLSNKMKATKLKELHKLLKNYDYTYVWADDRNSRIRGEKQRDAILKLKDEIGDEGQKMWMDFLKAKGMIAENGIKIRYFKEGKETGIEEYQKFVYSQMKRYGITNFNELDKKTAKEFWDAVDKKWKGECEHLKVNMPEQKRSLFYEMENVEGRGTLDWAIRQVGDKSLTAHSFCDAGNLYENVSKFIPPSEHRKKRMK